MAVTPLGVEGGARKTAPLLPTQQIDRSGIVDARCGERRAPPRAALHFHLGRSHALCITSAVAGAVEAHGASGLLGQADLRM